MEPMPGNAFWKIRLPLLRPAILVALIVRTVDAFRVFDIVYIITSGGPAYKTLTITYLTYLNSFAFGKQGTGAALSFLISTIHHHYGAYLYSLPVSPGGDSIMSHRKLFRKASYCFFSRCRYFSLFSFPCSGCLVPAFPLRWNCFQCLSHWIPQHPTFQNYLDIFFPSQAASSVPRTFAISLLNSIKIASAVTIICILIGSLAAYALVRIPFRI